MKLENGKKLNTNLKFSEENAGSFYAQNNHGEFMCEWYGPPWKMLFFLHLLVVHHIEKEALQLEFLDRIENLTEDGCCPSKETESYISFQVEKTEIILEIGGDEDEFEINFLNTICAMSHEFGYDSRFIVEYIRFLIYTTHSEYGAWTRYEKL